MCGKNEQIKNICGNGRDVIEKYNCRILIKKAQFTKNRMWKLVKIENRIWKYFLLY